MIFIKWGKYYVVTVLFQSDPKRGRFGGRTRGGTEETERKWGNGMRGSGERWRGGERGRRGRGSLSTSLNTERRETGDTTDETPARVIVNIPKRGEVLRAGIYK